MWPVAEWRWLWHVRACVCAREGPQTRLWCVCRHIFIITVLLFLFSLYTLSRMGATASREVFLIFDIEPPDRFPTPPHGPNTHPWHAPIPMFLYCIRNNSIGRRPDVRCPRERTVCDIIDYIYNCNVVIFLLIMYNLLYYAPYRAVNFHWYNIYMLFESTRCVQKMRVINPKCFLWLLKF